MKRTNYRLGKVADFETSIISIDIDNDSEDVISTGSVWKLNAPQYFKVNRSQFSKKIDFKQGLPEYAGNNCYIPTSSNCFTNSNNYITQKEYRRIFNIYSGWKQKKQGYDYS